MFSASDRLMLDCISLSNLEILQNNDTHVCRSFTSRCVTLAHSTLGEKGFIAVENRSHFDSDGKTSAEEVAPASPIGLSEDHESPIGCTFLGEAWRFQKYDIAWLCSDHIESVFRL